VKPFFEIDSFSKKPKKERLIRVLHHRTRLKPAFERSGLGIFFVKNKYKLLELSSHVKFKKAKTVPGSTKLLLDLNNNQYKLSGIMGENVWKSGKPVKTTSKLPFRLRGKKLRGSKSYPPHRLTKI